MRRPIEAATYGRSRPHGNGVPHGRFRKSPNARKGSEKFHNPSKGWAVLDRQVVDFEGATRATGSFGYVIGGRGDCICMTDGDSLDFPDLNTDAVLGDLPDLDAEDVLEDMPDLNVDDLFDDLEDGDD